MNKTKCSKFLCQLYKLLDENKWDCLKWNDDGQGFIAIKCPELIAKVIRVYYKQKSFASFIRQLNLYGFDRIKLSKKDNLFCHKYFIKGDRDLIEKIMSSSKLKKLDQLENDENNLRFVKYDHKQDELSDKLKALQEQQKLLMTQLKVSMEKMQTIKQGIDNLKNQIQWNDMFVNTKALKTQLLLCKLVKIVPKDTEHHTELFLIREILQIFNNPEQNNQENSIKLQNTPSSINITPLPFQNQTQGKIVQEIQGNMILTLIITYLRNQHMIFQQLRQ